MPSPSQPRSGPADGQSLNSSNSTSALFAGNVKRSWMSQIQAGNAQPSKTANLQDSNLSQGSIAPKTMATSLQSNFESSSTRVIPSDPHDRNSSSISPRQAPTGSDNVQAPTKRSRVNDRYDAIDNSVARSPNLPKRLRLGRPESSIENLVKESAATLPSPPTDKIFADGEFIAPSEPASISKPKKKLPLSISINAARTSASTPMQTRSPPLEVTITNRPLVTKPASQDPPTSLTGTLQSQERPGSVPAPSTTSDLPQNQSRPDNFQSNESHLATSTLCFSQLYEEVDARLDRTSRQPRANPIELARLRLLKEACLQEDQFFLVLHQLHCDNYQSATPKSTSASIKPGVQVLQCLLAPNDQLTTEAVSWFSRFGRPPSSVDEEKLELQVWLFLEGFAIQWNQLLWAYPPQTTLPSSYVLKVHIPALTSVVLQQVIFRGILRTSWVWPHDTCIEQCESVFTENHRLTQNFLKDRLPDDPSIKSTVSRLEEMAGQKYTNIFLGHHAHSVRLQDTKNIGERAAQAAMPSDKSDSARLPQIPFPNATGMAMSRAYQPAFPNMDTQVLGHFYTGQPPQGTPSSSPGLAGPFSAPADRQHFSLPLQRSFSSTPAVANPGSRSLPVSVSQSPQVDRLQSPALSGVGNQEHQNVQPPIAKQALPSSNVASWPINALGLVQSNAVTAADATRAPTTDNITNVPPAAFQVRAAQAQGNHQMHPIWPIQQAAQSQSFRWQPQAVQMSKTSQSPDLGQMRQVAQAQKALRMRQSPYMQEQSKASRSQSSRQLLMPARSREGQLQQIPAPGNIPSSAVPASAQPLMIQTLQMHPQQHNMNNAYPIYYPMVHPSVSPHPAAVIVPIRDTRQVFVPPSQMLSSNQPSHNVAIYPPQMPNSKGPEIRFWNPDRPSEETKSFGYIKNVIFYEKLSTNRQVVQWKEKISDDVIQNLPTEKTDHSGLPFYQVRNGSYLARIKCIKLKNSDNLPGISLWVTSGMSWPSLMMVAVNGAFLETRRKSPAGKDLAIDVTRLLIPGENMIDVRPAAFPVADCIGHWLFGLEIVEVVDAASVKQMLTFQTYMDSRNRILDKLRSKDLDFEVVNPQTLLNMTDPFTSRIFDTPVRGKYCAHNQCFDLETFLQTRGTMSKSEPCSTEEFRCPICKGDVRPCVMVVDGFLASIRSELEKRGRLDVKAVIVHESGEWEIQEEEEDSKDKSDGTLSNPQPRGPEKPHIESPISSETRTKGKEKETVEVIILDDD